MHPLWRVLIIVSLLTATASWAKPIALVKKEEGDVKVKRSDQLILPKVGDQLQVNDIVLTGSNGKIGMIFHDGALLSLGPNSTISIDSYLFQPTENKFDFKLDMKQGMAKYSSGKIGKLQPDAFEMKVPEGIIGTRGTSFAIEVPAKE